MAAESWVRMGKDFPTGGVTVQAQYRKGNQSSKDHLPAIGPALKKIFSCDTIFPGSLNLHAQSPVQFQVPVRANCNGAEWLFVPVIIAESVVGIAARRPPPEASEFLKVFACTQLAPQLGISYDDHVSVRILSGSHLGLAA